jgi:hypothetical protein
MKLPGIKEKADPNRGLIDEHVRISKARGKVAAQK